MSLGLLGIPLFLDPTDGSALLKTYMAAEALTAVRELSSRLAIDPRFRRLEGELISRGPSGAGVLQLGHMTHWWAWRANVVGSEQATAELDAYLNSDTISVWQTTWLYGPRVARRTPLTADVDVLPIQLMPASREKAAWEMPVMSSTNLSGNIPTAALVTELEVPKVRTAGSISPDDTAATHLDIALLLNTFPGVVAVAGLHTGYPLDSVPPGPFGSGGGGQSLHDIVVRREAEMRFPAETDMSELLAAYRRLPDRMRFRQALLRFSFAKGRMSPCDQAVDLGIVLETLLLPERRRKKGITASLQERGAWLLGGSSDDRAATAATIKEAYGIRSDVVHEGASNRLPLFGGNPNVNPLSEHLGVTERIARKLILDPPADWSLAHLNGEPC